MILRRHFAAADKQFPPTSRSCLKLFENADTKNVNGVEEAEFDKKTLRFSALRNHISFAPNSPHRDRHHGRFRSVSLVGCSSPITRLVALDRGGGDAKFWELRYGADRPAVVKGLQAVLLDFPPFLPLLAPRLVCRGLLLGTLTCGLLGSRFLGSRFLGSRFLGSRFLAFWLHGGRRGCGPFIEKR